MYEKIGSFIHFCEDGLKSFGIVDKIVATPSKTMPNGQNCGVIDKIVAKKWLKALYYKALSLLFEI